MKIDARLVKQSVGMIVGGVIFAWSAMDKGRIDGIKEGKRLSFLNACLLYTSPSPRDRG